VEVYWWVDGEGVGAPSSYGDVLEWQRVVPVSNAKGLGVDPNGFNSTSFDEVKTDRLRLDISSDGTFDRGSGVEGLQQRAVPLFRLTLKRAWIARGAGRKDLSVR